MDNYATHKTPAVKAWMERHPRFKQHFIPTSSSWLNQVERWFGLLSQRLLKRGVHLSVKNLEADLRRYVDTNNAEPKPFVWVKSADEILDRIARFCSRLRSEQGL